VRELYMIPIRKSTEPQILQQYRLQPGAEYDGAGFTPDVKDAIRSQLVNEQGFLCAYCMGRIEPDSSSMKIDHWHCQDKYEDEQLDYANLLGCCCGIGNKTSDEYCDTSKKNSDIQFNPSNAAHYSRMQIRYKHNGEISSDNSQFDKELNDVLNLNYSRLKENRKCVWNSVTKELSKISGTAKPAEIGRLLGMWKLKSGGKLQEYCGVAIYYLEKKLSITQ